MLKLFSKVEKVLVSSILVILVITIILSFFDVIHKIYLEMTSPPYLLINSNNLLDMFSIFLVVIIGIELLETVKSYLLEHVIHVELVILVAMIAIARKVIVWDFSKQNSSEMFALAAMMIALGCTFFILKKVLIQNPDNSPENKNTKKKK